MPENVEDDIKRDIAGLIKHKIAFGNFFKQIVYKKNLLGSGVTEQVDYCLPGPGVVGQTEIFSPPDPGVAG